MNIITDKGNFTANVTGHLAQYFAPPPEAFRTPTATVEDVFQFLIPAKTLVMALAAASNKISNEWGYSVPYSVVKEVRDLILEVSKGVGEDFDYSDSQEDILALAKEKI